MEKSRNTILENIGRNKPAPSPMPEIPDFEQPREDLAGLFSHVLEKVGGRVVEAGSDDALPAEIKKGYPEARQIWSAEEGLLESTITIQADTDPHQLVNLDLVVVRGALGVAENGAVWVSEKDLPLRVVLFITNHLAIILEKDRMVWNMHQAYQRMGHELPGFGVFISGPSKTADIEQSLVVGAQGPKSLTVYLV